MALKLNPVTGQLDVVLDKASEIKQTGSTSGIGAATVQDALDALGAPTAKNYIRYSDAEIGTTTGWSLGNVTLTSNFPSGVPTFGSGASANLSFTNTTVTPLAGTRSFLLSSSAATTAGNFLASDAFTIDSADLAKVLTVSFVYQLTSGTGNFSGTSSNSFGIAIYDVTASAWIQPAGVWAMTQSSGVGQAVATFQTPITSTQYRLVIFNANATSGAVSLEFDRISVSPTSTPVGAPVTEWQSYTPTLSNSTSVLTNTARWRRIGDSIEINGAIEWNGGGAGGTFTVALPVGLNIDTTKINNTTNRKHEIGWARFFDSGVASNPVTVEYSSANTIQFSTNTSTSLLLAGTNFTSGDTLAYGVTVPVVGYGSQVQMSSDTDTRVVDFTGYVSTNQALTANVTNLPVTSEKDSHGAWSGSTYVVPVSGDYNISAMLLGSGAATLVAYINGISDRILGTISNTQYYVVTAALYNLKAGDVISIRSQQNVTVTGNAVKPYQGLVSISRLSGPSVVAASETVACRYTNTAGTSVSTSYVIIPYATKNYDTHNAYNGTTGLFTAPVTGKYLVSAAVNMSQGSQPILSLAIYKNGVQYDEWQSQYSSSTTPISLTLCDTINLNAGDTISIYCKNSIGAVAISTVAGRNFLNIVKVSQ